VPAGTQGTDLKVGIDFSVTIDRQIERTSENEIKQILEDLGLTGNIQFEQQEKTIGRPEGKIREGACVGSDCGCSAFHQADELLRSTQPQLPNVCASHRVPRKETAAFFQDQRDQNRQKCRFLTGLSRMPDFRSVPE
jgi:hypothetical protein